MADSDELLFGKLLYYSRERFWNHVITTAKDGLQKYNNDYTLKFFICYSMIMQDQLQEGMRGLEQMKNIRDYNLCSTLCLIMAHKRNKIVEQEAISQLDAKLKTERKQSGEKGLYFAGLFLFLTRRYDKAREYIDRAFKTNSHSAEILSLKGWHELESSRMEDNNRKALDYFDNAINISSRNIDALLGKAKFLELKQNFSVAMDCISKVIVTGGGKLIPGLVQKMKLSLSMLDWDQMIENAHRCLERDESCLEAQIYLLLNLICREGEYETASQDLTKLGMTLRQREPKNQILYAEIVSLFSRCCGGNPLILQETHNLIEECLSMAEPGSNSPAFLMIELGHQLLLQSDRTKEALKSFRAAIKQDESSVDALLGIIECQLLENQLDEAQQQLEFLNEIQMSVGLSPQVLYLTAVLQRKKDKGSLDKRISLLNDATKLHFDNLRGLRMSAEYIQVLNPAFVIKLVEEYLREAPDQPERASSAKTKGSRFGPSGENIHPILKQSANLLQSLIHVLPGLHTALFLTAKVKFLSGDLSAAEGTLKLCLEKNPTVADAHILMAQIALHQRNFQQANQSLDQGLSYNFEVRNHPLFHLIKGRIASRSGDDTEAVNLLQSALTLPGVRKRSAGTRRQISGGRRRQNINQDNDSEVSGIPLNSNDRLAIFVELAESYRRLGQHPEAAKVMQDAAEEFRGSAQANTINIAEAELSAAKGDTQNALTILRAITPELSHYIEAQQKMAEIYLRYRKDKRLFIGCYRELFEKQPSPQTQLLLGDAYINIQEPEKAIQIYEAALKKNPLDALLASKIGQALVKTHQYGKAINYYEAALRNLSQKDSETSQSGGMTQAVLRRDLTRLLVRLRQYDKAEKVLRQVLDSDHQVSTIQQMMEETAYLTLLSQINKKQRRMSDSLDALTKAKDIQMRVLRRAPLEAPNLLSEAQLMAAQVCCDMAERGREQNQVEEAIKLYEEALSYARDATSLPSSMLSVDAMRIMLELARLHMQTGDLDLCEKICMEMLKSGGGDDEKDEKEEENENKIIGPTGSPVLSGRLKPKVKNLSSPASTAVYDDAIVMMADLMVRKNDYDSAVFHFKRILESRPAHYPALAKMVDLMRRSGSLESVPGLFDAALSAMPRAALDPGFNYCKGLYEWYTGRSNEALKLLNLARKDSREWAKPALASMVEICLNPDSNTIGGEVFEAVDMDTQTSDSDQMALRTAEKLLRELRTEVGNNSSSDSQRGGSYIIGGAVDLNRVSHLENMWMIATKSKGQIERALQSFTEAAARASSNNQSLVGPIYGSAAAFMTLKQTTRARSELKKIIKNPWTAEDAEDLERAWLLLADIYIQANKYDQAGELLRKVLQHNKSCSKAYEYMGYITEKEQKYKDAALSYELAWKYSNQNSPVIGYKLAFSYMKSKRFTDAIKICHHVLGAHPNYPKIRKEILDKSRSQLRI